MTNEDTYTIAYQYRHSYFTPILSADCDADQQLRVNILHKATTPLSMVALRVYPNYPWNEMESYTLDLFGCESR